MKQWFVFRGGRRLWRSSWGLVLGVGVALAAPSATMAQEGDRTEYVFDDEIVPGDLQNPMGELLRVRQRDRRASLIRPRESFLVELAESADEL